MSWIEALLGYREIVDATGPSDVPLPQRGRLRILSGVLADNPTADSTDLTPSAGGAGTGDVTGPSSAVANAIAIFSGTTGKIIKAALATIDSAGNAAFSGTLHALLKAYDMAAVGGAQANLNLGSGFYSGLLQLVHLHTSGAVTCSGLVAPGAPLLRIFYNDGPDDWTWVHDLTSTAANRFLCVGGSSLTQTVGTFFLGYYDTHVSRWRILPLPGSSSGGGVPPARTITAGTGLTGGGDLSADRAFAVSFGTTGTTACAGNDSRVTGAVQNTRQVLAGTGLTGGGALSADVTINVSYGTAAGTAAQGNDSRITGAAQSVRQIIAGSGLTGGGDLTADRTLTVAYGLVAAIANVATTAAAGVANAAARADHVHALTESVVRSVLATLTAAVSFNGQDLSSLKSLLWTTNEVSLQKSGTTVLGTSSTRTLIDSPAGQVAITKSGADSWVHNDYTTYVTLEGDRNCYITAVSKLNTDGRFVAVKGGDANGGNRPGGGVSIYPGLGSGTGAGGVVNILMPNGSTVLASFGSATSSADGYAYGGGSSAPGVSFFGASLVGQAGIQDSASATARLNVAKLARTLLNYGLVSNASLPQGSMPYDSMDVAGFTDDFMFPVTPLSATVPQGPSAAVKYVLGTGADVTSIAPTGGSLLGVLQLTTGSTATGLAQISNASSTNGGYIYFLGSSTGRQDVRFAARVSVPVVSTATQRARVVVGIANLELTSRMAIHHDDAVSANWLAVCEESGTRTTVDTGVPVAAGSWYRMVIRCLSNTVYFSINGTLVATISTNVPGRSAVSPSLLAPVILVTKSAGTTPFLVLADFWELEVPMGSPLQTTTRVRDNVVA